MRGTLLGAREGEDKGTLWEWGIGRTIQEVLHMRTRASSLAQSLGWWLG